MPQDHWLPGFNFNVEEWDAKFGGNRKTAFVAQKGRFTARLGC